MTERIVVDGEPLSEEEFVAAFNDVAPFTHLVDADSTHPLSFFETVVGMAFAKFAEAPVDVAVVEVGMGGAWDATNVADARVAVLTPIAVDHAKYLGDPPGAIAQEKVGIIKPGSTVVTALQDDDVHEAIVLRCQEVGATLVREGVDFGVEHRVPAVGGQVVTLRGLRGVYSEVFIPLYGAHQAQNAALALATVESFLPARTRCPPRSWRRPSSRPPRRDGWRSCAARPRSCWTPRTTPTAPAPWWRRSRTASPSAR